MAKDSEYKDLIAAVYRIVGAAERRFDALRDSDRQAVALAHSDLSRRLEGFPQQYATKIEAEAAAAAVQRLEKDSLPREIYDQNHKILAEAVIEMDKEKLDESVFDTFLDNYRREQTLAADERRNVAEVLATATERVRAQVLEERGDYITQEFYDTKHNDLVKIVNEMQAWQYKIIGALVFATFIAPLITGILVYLFTTGAL